MSKKFDGIALACQYCGIPLPLTHDQVKLSFSVVNNIYVALRELGCSYCGEVAPIGAQLWLWTPTVQRQSSGVDWTIPEKYPRGQNED